MYKNAFLPDIPQYFPCIIMDFGTSSMLRTWGNGSIIILMFA